MGAGASWASPAGRPLFTHVRRALFAALDVPVADPQSLMAPEALLSRLAGRGIDIDAELRQMLRGGDPNAVHFAAATALGQGCSVWTTNFDELIEAACLDLHVDPHRLLPGDDPACDCRQGHLVKIHGTFSGQRVIARSEDVLAPLPEGWLRRLESDLTAAHVAIVGYAGADIDLRSGLRQALNAATDVRWFGLPRDRLPLETRFPQLAKGGTIAFQESDRPDLAFLDWAARYDLTVNTPAHVATATAGPLPPVAVPDPTFEADSLLRASVADDFGQFGLARKQYRRAVIKGPKRAQAAAAVLSTGLIHGAFWRPPVAAGLHAACASPLRWAWPHRQLMLYLTWSGQTATAWRAAQRALARTREAPSVRIQAANVAKECAPAQGERLAAAAQAWALEHHQQRTAAWMTLCRSLSLRWLGKLDEAAEQAAQLADGFDALAGPVWAAWGHFETGAVAALRGDAETAVSLMRQAREVFAAAGADNFVFDATCGELAAERLRDLEQARSLYRQAQRLIDQGIRTSRFAREVLLVEAGELARADGRLQDAEAAFSQLDSSPTAGQLVLGLLGMAEVQRARGIEVEAAWRALDKSRELEFAFGEVHAAITLGLAAALPLEDAEAIIAHSVFKPPVRPGAEGLLRFCLGPDPALHAISFP